MGEKIRLQMETAIHPFHKHLIDYIVKRTDKDIEGRMYSIQMVLPLFPASPSSHNEGARLREIKGADSDNKFSENFQ